MTRRTMIILLAVLMLPLALFGAAFALAQTDIAKDQISGLVEENLSGPDQQAEVTGLAGLLPFDVTVGRVRLSDDQGVWLEVDKARIQTSASELLAGRIVVEDLGIERVRLNRLPPAGPDTAPETEPASDGLSLPQLPLLPSSVPAFSAERIHVDRIELAEPLLGEPAIFNLEGKAASGGDGTMIDAALSLTRTDDPSAQLTLKAGADLKAQTIEIDLKGSETGGLVASLSGQPDAGDLALTLKGQGPLDDFAANLSLEAQNLAQIEADLRAGIGTVPKLVLKAAISTADGFLPPEVSQLIGQEIQIDIDAQEQSPGIFDIATLDLQAGQITMNGGGRADINANTIDINTALKVADLARAGGLAGRTLGGDASLGLSLTGALDQPDALIDLAGRTIIADRWGAEMVDLQIKAKPIASLTEGYPGLSVQSNGTIGGLSQDQNPLFEQQTVALDLAATIPVDGIIDLKKLTIEAGDLSAEATAAVDALTLEGTARAGIEIGAIDGLLRSLGPIAPADLAIKGAAALTLDAEFGQRAERLTANLQLETSDLSGLPAGTGPVAGAAPSITTLLEFNQGGVIKLQDLVVQLAGLSASGDLSFDQSNTALGGAIDLKMPALADLSDLAGQELAGSLDLSMDLGGNVDAPAAKIDLQARDLRAAGQAFDAVRLNGDLAGPVEAATGELRLETEKAGGILGLQASIARDAAAISLRDLRLFGPGTDIQGDVDLNIETFLASGTLKGAINDLARLKPWTGQPIEGRAVLDTVFDADGGTQQVNADIAVEQIDGAFGAVQSARLLADIRDALGVPSLEVTLDAKGVIQPGTTLDDARVDLAGRLDDLRLKADLQGDQNGPLKAALEARASLQGTVLELGPQSLRSLTLESLDAELQGQTFELQSPAAITLDDGVLDLDQLDLKVGAGTVKGKASIGDERVFAAFDLNGFELEAAESLGGPALSGVVVGKLRLDGTKTDPVIKSDFRIEDFALVGTSDAQALALIDGAFTVDRGKAVAKIGVGGLGTQPLMLKATFPMALSFDPLVADLRFDDLQATIDGRVDLARLASFARLDDQTINGTMTAALDIEGPLAEPRMKGSVGIVDGAIEDINTGARLQDIDILIDAKGDLIEIVEFRASDDGDGTISASGRGSWDAARNYPFDIKLVSEGLHLLNNDLGHAWINMDLQAKGDVKKAAITGLIGAQEIDLIIPSRFAASIDSIPVQEINKIDELPGEPASGQAPVDMDLAITIDIPAKIFVRGRGLDSEWSGDLTIDGTVAEPQLAGLIAFKRGHLDLLDRRFAIEQGLIDFDGAVPPNPSILFQASSEGETIKAIVTVSGKSSAPEIDLSSDPARPQDEVLAQLLFGRELSAITPAQGIRLAAAANELQGGAGINPLGALRDTVGLDTLDVGGESVDQASARAGKYLADNVYLEIERGVTPNSGKARIEIELSDHLTADTEVTESSQTGVGLNWKYDY